MGTMDSLWYYNGNYPSCACIVRANREKLKDMKRVTLYITNSWYESQEIELGVFSNETIANEFANRVSYIIEQSKSNDVHIDRLFDILLTDFECYVNVSTVVSNDNLDAWDALENAQNEIGLMRA